MQDNRGLVTVSVVSKSFRKTAGRIFLVIRLEFEVSQVQSPTGKTFSHYQVQLSTAHDATATSPSIILSHMIFRFPSWNKTTRTRISRMLDKLSGLKVSFIIFLMRIHFDFRLAFKVQQVHRPERKLRVPINHS